MEKKDLKRGMLVTVRFKSDENGYPDILVKVRIVTVPQYGAIKGSLREPIYWRFTKTQETGETVNFAPFMVEEINHVGVEL